MLFVGIQESSRNSLLQDRKHHKQYSKGKSEKPGKAVVAPGNRCQSLEMPDKKTDSFETLRLDRWLNMGFIKDEKDGETRKPVAMLRNTLQRCL